MGRRKIEIKAIKDDRNRSVTFLKRKGGLFKKAHELSVLCSVDVAVFIFGNNKKLYEYSSSDMRDLITRYTYHGGPNEHKGPSDFNGGADDDDDEDGDATPPHVHEGSVEPQMIPPHFQGQPQFAHLRHAPSASPPMNGVHFVQRGHTPQPQMGSRPSSRNDFRRGPMMAPQQVGPQGPQPVNGYGYMPQPPMYQQNPQPSMPPSMQHGMPQAGPQYPYPPPQAHPQMQPYMDDQRRSSLPPSYPPQPHQQPRTSPPQPHPQQLPQQAAPHMSPPQPHPQIIEPPQQQQQEAAPPAPMEPKSEPSPPQQKPSQPLLDTNFIKKLPQRKQHSIFTPIDEDRSILSRHLASFAPDQAPKEESLSNRSQSVDVGAVSRENATRSPPVPQRSNTSSLARNSVSAIPETTFTPPSRSNSLRVGGTGGAARPRLTVQIPDEASEAGDNTGEPVTSPRNAPEGAAQTTRAGVVLPPPSPSASALLSAGATGPPNPFARPAPQQNSQMNIDTPVSALPSRFLNNEFLPSPSSFYPEWNFRGGDSNTLPSPLNFATPVVGSGPSFLRDDHSNQGPNAANKRKSPEISTAHPGSDGPEEAKRLKVDGRSFLSSTMHYTGVHAF